MSKDDTSNAPVTDNKHDAVNEYLSAPQRKEQILDMVRGRGFVSIDALAHHFYVTPQTIRRDINRLCQNGLLRRYHGGAGLPSSVENVDYTARRVLCLDEKKRIARLLAGHIPDKASLFINIGTTTEEVAKALLSHKGLRVITNNLNVAQIMSQKDDFEVSIAGGIVRTKDGGIIGQATIDFIQQFKVDFGIIGISGIDEDGSLLDFDFREVNVSQAIIANSRKVFLAADHSKFGRNAMVRLGNISEIDVLFTDRQPPTNMIGFLSATDVKLYVADIGPNAY